MALAGMSAVSRFLLTKVVGTLPLFHSTFDVDRKFDPTTLNVKDGPPCWLLFGDKASILGTGLERGGFADPTSPLPPQPARQMAAKSSTEVARGEGIALFAMRSSLGLRKHQERVAEEFTFPKEVVSPEPCAAYAQEETAGLEGLPLVPISFFELSYFAPTALTRLDRRDL